MASSSAETKNILVVLLGALGDVTRGLAVAQALKAQRDFTAEFHITWLVERKCADIVRMCPDVNEVIVFERSAGVRGFFKAVTALRSKRFDIVLDLQRHAKSGLFSWLSGAKRRIGFHPKNTKEKNHWFNTEYIARWNGDVTAAKSSKLKAYLSFLTPLDISIPEIPSWNIDETRVDAELRFRAGLKVGAAEDRIGLVLGSSWESKDWMGFPKLCAQLLAERRSQIILIGDASCEHKAQELSALDPTRVVSTAGKLSLAQLVAELRQCTAVIGPDSGPGHISAAIGVPYIGIFGPTDPSFTAPFGSEDLTISAQIGCAPCYRRECPGLGKLCLRLITPAAVMQKLRLIETPFSKISS